MASGAEAWTARKRKYGELILEWDPMNSRDLPAHIQRMGPGRYQKWCNAEHWAPIELFHLSEKRDDTRLQPRCEYHRSTMERKTRTQPSLPPDAGQQLSLV